MVLFDSTILLPLMRRGIPVRPDPSTGEPISHVEARLSRLVTELEKSRTRIVIPTPVLSELLIRAGSSTNQLVASLQKSSVFRIEPFDTRAAIELAEMTRAILASGSRRGAGDSTYAKLRFDRQIIAIAKVHAVRTIYTDDFELGSFAKTQGFDVVNLLDLPIPGEELQAKLSFPEVPDNG
jgi:predicted nucleic acid-binding protein